MHWWSFKKCKKCRDIFHIGTDFSESLAGAPFNLEVVSPDFHFLALLHCRTAIRIPTRIRREFPMNTIYHVECSHSGLDLDLDLDPEWLLVPFWGLISVPGVGLRVRQCKSAIKHAETNKATQIAPLREAS